MTKRIALLALLLAGLSVVAVAQTRPLKIDNRPETVVATYVDEYDQAWQYGDPDTIVVVFPEPVQEVHVDTIGGTMACTMLNGFVFGVTVAPQEPIGNLGLVMPDNRIVSCELIGGGFSNLVATVGE